MPQIEGLEVPASFISIKGLLIALLGFVACLLFGWAMIKGYLGSGKGAGSGFQGVGAAMIAVPMFSLLPLVFGTVASAMLGGPYDGAMQRVGTTLVFLATQAAWNVWLYLLGGFDFFYYD
jgi:hypothetical protein